MFVVPGIEVTTHGGHLLALFAPEALDELDAFSNPTNLQLMPGSAAEQRSARSMLDLVGEIDRRGGLAIPAHVDAADGIHQKLSPSELADLLASPALAGLEFHRTDALKTWFTDHDPSPDRKAAWRGRQAVVGLRDRGLGRLMSSDAHSADKVGQDRSARTLTRLRLDDLNFDALRLAIQLNPKARCKADAILPATYPRIQSVELKGGFLDGVKLDFSPNLNCVIGGRGAGKSTALLAIRAALGAQLGSDDNADDEHRMPEETRVHFIDSTGSERIACRRRGEVARRSRFTLADSAASRRPRPRRVRPSGARVPRSSLRCSSSSLTILSSSTGSRSVRTNCFRAWTRTQRRFGEPACKRKQIREARERASPAGGKPQGGASGQDRGDRRVGRHACGTSTAA